jgi:hypothetical protein
VFLNIITPCSRPENLLKISESINVPKEHYRWIVVFDMDKLPSKELIPENCEVHLYRENGSVVGHAQRNYALSIINDGHIYFNDDDTLLHSELWENIKDFNFDFLSFNQLLKNGNPRLKSGLVSVGDIDSHNFIVSNDIVKDTRFIVGRYDADGHFATECYKKSIIILYINKFLSIYNSLR